MTDQTRGSREIVRRWLINWFIAILDKDRKWRRFAGGRVGFLVRAWYWEIQKRWPVLHSLPIYLTVAGVYLELVLLDWISGVLTGFYPITSFFQMLLDDYRTRQANRFDLFLGLLLGAMTAIGIGVLIASREIKRFDKDLHGGGGPKKEVRLPLSRKVISLDEYRVLREKHRQEDHGPKNLALGNV